MCLFMNITEDQWIIGAELSPMFPQSLFERNKSCEEKKHPKGTKKGKLMCL